MMDKKSPKNTSKEDPRIHLLMAMAIGGSNAIEIQERTGQSELVNSDTLPTNMTSEAKTILESYGVRFLGDVEGDNLFQYVDLPHGWTKRETGHSIHSELLDGKGRKRAKIFYKAAFYDRSAGLHISRRFHFHIDWDKLELGMAESVVVDAGNEIYRTDAVSFDINDESSNQYKLADVADNLAQAWLADNYPNWKDASAYWD